MNSSVILLACLAVIVSFEQCSAFRRAGGIGNQVNIANQRTTAVGGPGSVVVASGTANAGNRLFRRTRHIHNQNPLGGGSQINIANQETNIRGGAGSTLIGDGTATAGNAGGFSSARGQVNIANQKTVATGGANSVVVASGSAVAGNGRRGRDLAVQVDGDSKTVSISRKPSQDILANQTIPF